MKTIWKYLRWIFPPYLVWRFILVPVYRVVTWPFRAIKNKLFGQRVTAEWALKYLQADRDRTNKLYQDFLDVFREKQYGASYISIETIDAVAKRNDLTLKQMLFLLASPAYPRGWVIDDWKGICQAYGVQGSRKHSTGLSTPRQYREEHHGELIVYA